MMITRMTRTTAFMLAMTTATTMMLLLAVATPTTIAFGQTYIPGVIFHATNGITTTATSEEATRIPDLGAVFERTEDVDVYVNPYIPPKPLHDELRDRIGDHLTDVCLSCIGGDQRFNEHELVGGDDDGRWDL